MLETIEFSCLLNVACIFIMALNIKVGREVDVLIENHVPVFCDKLFNEDSDC